MQLSARLTKTLLVILTFAGQPASSQEQFWEPTGGPLATQDVRMLAANSQGVLFAGTYTHGEVYKTTDNGDTWTVCAPLPVPNPVYGLAVDQHNHIFASVYLQGVARSTDDGASWQPKNNGLTNLAIRVLLVDRSGKIWVASEGGMFCSTNEGETWTLKKSGWYSYVIMDSTGAVLAREENIPGNSILHRSSDGGASWSSVVMEGIGITAVHPDGAYWANSYQPSRTFRSTDQGATWTDMQTPVSWTGITTWTMITKQGDVFYSLDGPSAGIVRSTDNGVTWQVTNDGLTSKRVVVMYPHPNGTLFCGTATAGVFRSTAPVNPQEITVTLPNVEVAAGTTLEIPINVTSLSGWGICAYDFTISFNSPDSILSMDATGITNGTLSGVSGWSVVLNTTNPNEVRVGAYGATPLFGQGILLKLKVTVAPIAQAGDSTRLAITHFLLNAGGPEPSIDDGSLVVRAVVCGDADENGQVQAYDAAVTLREALGPMAPPPPPLTTMGRLNADVSLDGKVQAYDAALILRHAIGLAMPESTTSCFGGSGSPSVTPELQLSANVLGVEHGTSHTAVLLGLENVPDGLAIYSFSFELLVSATSDDTTSLTLPQLGSYHLATVNRIGNGHFRVGVINPYGVDVENIPITLTAKHANSLNNITLSEVALNNAVNPVITLTNVITAIEPSISERVMPTSYDLVAAYPNPFNPSTRIVFRMPSSAHVRLEVYSTVGVKVKTLFDDQLGSGQHEVQWDGTNDVGKSVASGPYFCIMRTGGFKKSIQILLLK